MADKNLEEKDVSRAEAAENLRAIADELDGGEEMNIDVGEEMNIDVENKTIALSPTDSVGYEVGVRERSSILRGSRESVTITLDWKPEQ